MYLSDFDLQQLDEQKLRTLPAKQKDGLLVKLLWDLQEARERLKANSQTSSRPPRGDPPWHGAVSRDEDSEASGNVGGTDDPDADDEGAASAAKHAEPKGLATPAEAKTPAGAAAGPGKKAGRPPGAAGPSRQVTLPINDTLIHAPESCARCAEALDSSGFVAQGGRDVLDLDTDRNAELPGLRIRHDKPLYGEIACNQCGHVNRSEPGRCRAEPEWSVALSEWHLVGPMLVSLLVCFSQRMHLSRRLTQEFLRDWLGVALSTSTINQCIHEAGRAVEPIEDPWVEELQQEVLAGADETPWKKWGQLLWLWVIITPTICLYFIGRRSKEILENVFSECFVGWLMSDGYQVYRRFQKRLRGWAHLLRKAEGLKESLSSEAQAFGQATHELLNDLMIAIYEACASPPEDLTPRFRERLESFRRQCEQHQDSAHEKTRALAREFLNDWEAFWIVVAHPYLPLTNKKPNRPCGTGSSPGSSARGPAPSRVPVPSPCWPA